jgi:hypothetical protein
MMKRASEWPPDCGCCCNRRYPLNARHDAPLSTSVVAAMSGSVDGWLARGRQVRRPAPLVSVMPGGPAELSESAAAVPFNAIAGVCWFGAKGRCCQVATKACQPVGGVAAHHHRSLPSLLRPHRQIPHARAPHTATPGRICALHAARLASACTQSTAETIDMAEAEPALQLAPAKGGGEGVHARVSTAPAAPDDIEALERTAADGGAGSGGAVAGDCDGGDSLSMDILTQEIAAADGGDVPPVVPVSAWQ